MILKMLEEIKGQHDRDFLKRVENLHKKIAERMQKEGRTDDLAFVMENAEFYGEDEGFRGSCMSALYLYYKFSRIGLYYVSGEGIERKIRRICIPEEEQIRVILEEGTKSDDIYVRSYAKSALRSMCDHYSNLCDD